MSGADLSGVTSGKVPSESQPSSRIGENPPYGMRAGIEETSASCEARYAPRSYPTTWVKTQLHTAGLVERAKRRGAHRRKRERKPCQDRLIKELAKAGITEIAAANAWIRDIYLPAHNARFARPAAVAQSAFVKVADNAVLRQTLCVQGG